ncbi:unnamed protein product [Amoebophrya sp. A25]|nr:unnamed protein product [Amoebophrya sp. A25]|eukprot:GSA25T00013965001.1
MSGFSLSSASKTIRGVTHLCQVDAIAVDKALFRTFSVDSLMELAGLSCAQVIEREFPRTTRTLIIAGPGNNGGDGLVAARHLHHFGYKEVSVLYPRPGTSDVFTRLQQQLRQIEIPVFSSADEARIFGGGQQGISRIEPKGEADTSSSYDLLVDAIFGFSFRGWRGGGKDAPFDALVDFLAQTSTPVVSIDIPSGWQIDGTSTTTGENADSDKHQDVSAPGPGAGPGPHGRHGENNAASGNKNSLWQPKMLISLTAPKLAAAKFSGTHYLGGRFLPANFGLTLPPYPGSTQVVRLSPSEEKS